MTSDGLGEMFKGDSADTCTGGPSGGFSMHRPGSTSLYLPKLHPNCNNKVAFKCGFYMFWILLGFQIFLFGAAQ